MVGGLEGVVSDFGPLLTFGLDRCCVAAPWKPTFGWCRSTVSAATLAMRDVAVAQLNQPYFRGYIQKAIIYGHICNVFDPEDYGRVMVRCRISKPTSAVP